MGKKITFKILNKKTLNNLRQFKFCIKFPVKETKSQNHYKF